MRALCGLALASVLVGCGDEQDYGSWSVTDQPLQGVIGGQPWTFAEGETDAFLSDEESFFTQMFAEAYDTCVSLEPEGPQILVGVPTAVGTYDFGSQLNITFSPSSGENLVSMEGGIEVTEITETTVSGGLYSEFDSDNEVDGTFTITLCPE